MRTRVAATDVARALRRARVTVARRAGVRRPGSDGFGWANVTGWILFAAALIGAVFALRQAPWIPVVYLAALIGGGMAVWRFSRWRGGKRLLRWSGLAAAALGVMALIPVPWMDANLDTPPGTAWRLDGRLEVNGEIADPSGEWYWLTAGRPPIVAEVVRSWLVPGADELTDLRGGRTASQPNVSEPAAAIVGVHEAGLDVDHVDAQVGGWLSRTPPGQWFRKLAVGKSHGMMVALVTYTHVSDDDLAQGRSIAGTGGIGTKGTVTSIGGLTAKATAARDAGADVMLYPQQQAFQLDDFDAGSMQLIGVSTLGEAIEALSAPPVSSKS